MTSYEFLLLAHIITVIVWLGAGFTMDLLFLRVERTGDPVDLGKTGQFQEWLVPRLFIPFGVLTPRPRGSASANSKPRRLTANRTTATVSSMRCTKRDA